MADLLADTGLQLNPDVPHPSFTWRVDLPQDATWSILDTHPSTWQRAADRLVELRLVGQRVKAAQKREITRFVADLVAQCQQSGALLSMVQIGFLPSGEVATGGLHLAWYDSTPDLADLATVRRAISRQGIVEEHDTEAGPVLLQRDHVSIDAFGSGTRVGLASLQAFLPVAGHPWTLVAATATPHQETVELLHDLVLGVVSSFEILESVEADVVEAAPAWDPDAPGYRAVETPQAPGITRGFGTFRVEGDQARRDD